MKLRICFKVMICLQCKIKYLSRYQFMENNRQKEIINSESASLQEEVQISLSKKKAYESNKQHNDKNSCMNYLVIILIVALFIIMYLYSNARCQESLIKQQNNYLKEKHSEERSRFKLFSSNNLKKNHDIQDKEDTYEEDQEPKTKQTQTRFPPIQDKAYLTPQLQAISEGRKQTPGMIKTPKGTVSELKPLITNQQGESIEKVLYPNQDIQELRKLFVAKRSEFISTIQKDYQSIQLSKYTIKLNRKLDQQQKDAEQKQYERIRVIHSLDSYTSELPMCVVVPSFNNNAKFRIQFNLNSIFLQNYTNYFAIIINDASTDGSDQVYRKYFDFYKIDTHKYLYIQNKQRNTAMQNLYIAITQYCSQDSIVVNLDGDDEFIGKNVLKIFNANYQRTKMGVIYSNYYRFRSETEVEAGWTKEYPVDIKLLTTFRTSPQYFSHLKSHRAILFRKIPVKEFQDDNGKFFTITSDMAIYYPLMEVACGKVLKIDGYHYLYNFNTGLNDFSINHEEQLKVEDRIRKGKKLPCYRDL